MSTGPSLLSLIGIGPGDLQQMTTAARAALVGAEVVIGYQGYIDQIRPLLGPDQEIVASPLGREMQRAEQAVEIAGQGQSVALISSGDIGLYGMASPLFEVLHQRNWPGDEPEVAVYPGISAVQAAAARLGAPLGHDFCTISLSDLLTPWPVIERRIQAAAWGDFVIAFYNPRSRKRTWQLPRALEILQAHRPATTPAAIVRNVTRPDEKITLTSLADLNPDRVDMFTLVLIGNSQSYSFSRRMVTPRGYKSDEADPSQRSDLLNHRPDSKSTTHHSRPAGGSPLSTTHDPQPIVHHPKSEISRSQSEIQNQDSAISQSAIRNPQSEIKVPRRFLTEFIPGKAEELEMTGHTPHSPIRNPKSAIRNPKSEIRNPKSDLYPISLIDMSQTHAVVIGGGPVGQRKVRGLLAAGAVVRLISPEATPQLQAWADAGRIGWARRPYQAGDLSGAQLVLAATNRREVNARIAREARSLGLLCNVADRPAEGNFHVPAVHRRPGLIVAVSTAGQSPTRARQIRDEIALWLEGDENVR